MYKFCLLVVALGNLINMYGEDIECRYQHPCCAISPCHTNMPFLSADFIYWFAKQEGNNYAITGSAITVPGTVDPNTGLIPGPIPLNGKSYAPDAKMNPGFKVGLGINLEYDQWTLFSEYTYLHSHAKSQISSNDLNAGVIPVYSYVANNSLLASATYTSLTGATGFVSKAISHWSLQFNNINLELKKWIPLFCNFVIQPHFGLQGSWQKQHFDATYFVNSFTDLTLSLGSNQIKYNQDFWGVGPRVGLDGTWQFSKHFSLFSASAFAALWGNFNTTSTSHDTNTAGGYADLLIAQQKYDPSTLNPVIELAIGVQSDWTFCRGYRLLGKAAWETQIWFYQNQHTTMIPYNNLILQGLTVSGQIDF